MCGKFSEEFKLRQRLQQADWTKEKTKEHWIDWAKETLVKSSPFKDLDLGDEDAVEVRLEEQTKDIVDPM